MEEIWSDYDDYYKVSTIGNVYSIKRNRLLNQNLNYCGYLIVSHYKTKKLVHRLVAEMFIPNPLNLPEINHIDGNKQNNVINNLEWCTHIENINHSMKTGLCNNNGKSWRLKLNETQIKEIRQLNGKLFHKEIAEKYGVSTVQITRILNNQSWKHVS